MSLALLRKIHPFRYLAAARLEALSSRLEALHLNPGDHVFRAGDVADKRVFLVAEGRVEVADFTFDPPARREIVHPGDYLGDRAVLFDEPRERDARALSTATLYAMAGDDFLGLVRDEPAFTSALGERMRQKQKVLVAFDEFVAAVLAGVASGRLDMEALLARYRALEPALHPHALDHARVDWGALFYAVRRLPENATRTLVYFLTDNVPAVWAEPEKSFRLQVSDVRPRSVYEMLPGKSMVLLRDPHSDLLDFLTCLCVLCVEGRKIRKRLRDPDLMLWVTQNAGSLAGSVTDAWSPDEAGDDEEKKALERLPFSEDEQRWLRRIWPGETFAHVRELVLHHEDYTLYVDRARNNYGSRHSERWAAQIAHGTQELLGVDPADLPPDVPVHVVSSNTHSVSNCLSAWMTSHTEPMLAWARAAKHKLLSHPWMDRHDAAYALARSYFKAHPEAIVARARADREAGLMRLQETAFTGIRVELMDLAKVARSGAIDGGLSKLSEKPALLVNIDFAFGQQADDIVGALIKLFGRNLASVNVLGKAGALTGKRGDLLHATGFVEQMREQFDPLPKTPLDRERLAGRVADRAVHEGPMLTVAGTLLQNRVMLQFYKRLWGCIGLEMEGAYYFRRVLEAQQRGLVREDLAQRYLYYVSDLPLDPASNLSEALGPHEGIPPLYAITREILSGVFDSLG